MLSDSSGDEDNFEPEVTVPVDSETVWEGYVCMFPEILNNNISNYMYVGKISILS